jgi:2-amino-4-hydroxy-6-hydroxymethyldihydropteridine diphosphokinase
MILIGLGSNVTGPGGTPGETLARAMGELDRLPVRLERASSIISTEPWGKADQPVYANAVARVRTRMQPLALLAHLRALERAGRA